MFIERLSDVQIGQHQQSAMTVDCDDDNGIPEASRDAVSAGSAFNAGNPAEPIDKAQKNGDESKESLRVSLFHLHCMHDRKRRAGQTIHNDAQQ